MHNSTWKFSYNDYPIYLIIKVLNLELYLIIISTLYIYIYMYALNKSSKQKG